MGGLKAASFPIIFALEGVKKPLYRPFLGKSNFCLELLDHKKLLKLQFSFEGGLEKPPPLW